MDVPHEAVVHRGDVGVAPEALHVLGLVDVAAAAGLEDAVRRAASELGGVGDVALALRVVEVARLVAGHVAEAAGRLHEQCSRCLDLGAGLGEARQRRRLLAGQSRVARPSRRLFMRSSKDFERARAMPMTGAPRGRLNVKSIAAQ